MRLARRLLVPPFALALGAAALTTAGVASTTPVAHAAAASLPSLAGFRQMAVDAADGHIFISESGSGGIIVTSLSGQYVTTLDAGDGALGIALDGSTLYAALPVPGQVAAINAATLTQTTTYALPSGDLPYSVAVQSGDVWVSYDTGVLGSAAIGDIDLATGTFQAATAGPATWYSAPELAADPSGSGLLVAELPGISPVSTATFNTTTSPATPIASVSDLGGGACAVDAGFAVVPGGSHFLATCYNPPAALEFSPANLTMPAAYYGIAIPVFGPIAVAVAPDGTVAAGTSQEVYLFQPDGTLLGSHPLDAGLSLASGGLAWSADSSALYAVVKSSSGNYSAGPAADFEQATSSITLTPPSPAPHGGESLAITGRLTFSNGPLPRARRSSSAGTTLTALRRHCSQHGRSAPATSSSLTFRLRDSAPTRTRRASPAGMTSSAPRPASR